MAAAGFGGFVLLVVAGVSYAYATTEVPTDAAQAATQQQSTVYFSDGKTVAGTLGTTDRQLLTYNQISPYMRDAVVAAEDRSFYNEGGVSPKGIVRAAYEDVFNSGGSQGSLQGGSTITQEFVRNYYANIGTQQTATRKIKEIFVALKVAKEKSKAWILTNYLNTIYLGNGAYGVGAAAKTYFGVPASQLTVAQAAEIAAIIQSPSYYPTAAGHAALVNRWHYVLNGMVVMGDISAAKAASLKFPSTLKPQDQTAGGSAYDQYILDTVKNELSAEYHLTSAQWDNDGLRIVTTLSKPMMDTLYHAVKVNEEQMAADGGALPSYAMVGAELQNPQTGAIVAFYGGPGAHTATKYCHGTCQLNTVLQREQVGSSFKPYVLATAVNQGMNVQTTQLDGYSPLWIPPDSEGTTPAARSQSDAGSNWFEEKNDNNDDYGPMSVAQAEAQSSNTAFTDLIHRVGTQNVINMAQKFGVNTGLLKSGGSGLQQRRRPRRYGPGPGRAVGQRAGHHAGHAGQQRHLPRRPPDPADQVGQSQQDGQREHQPGADAGQGFAGSVRDVVRHRERHRYRRGHGRRPSDHRQDRYHRQFEIGVLHRRYSAVRADRRHLHPEPERHLQPDPGQPGRQRRRWFRWLLAGPDLAHVRRGGVRVAADPAVPYPGVLRLDLEHVRRGRPASHRDAHAHPHPGAAAASSPPVHTAIGSGGAHTDPVSGDPDHAADDGAEL